MNLKEVLLSKIFKLVYLFIFMEISVIHANYIRFASNPKESNWENEYPEHDYLQEENGEHIYGSGKYDDYIDSFDEGGKYDDFEGSTDSSGNFKENNRNSNTYMGVPNHESRCLQMLHQAEKDDIPGSFMPRCTFDGYFSALQCHGSKGECWCSTKNGRQIPGTLTTDALSTCDKYDLETGKEKLPFDKKGKDLKKHKKMKAEDEDIILKRIETKNQQENKEFFIPYDNLSNNRKKTSKESVKKLNESASSHQQSEDFFVFSSLRFHSLLSQPGLLAAIVSLLLVFVLCISSVVVLSVCRLKQRSHKEETKSHLEAESVINGYNSHLTYPHRLDNTAEIYAGGGFSYTPGISPAKCQTMNLRMSPWAHGNGYLTNKSSHLMYSKCADQEMFA